MPWSGSGVYNLPPAFSPEVNGTVIDATRYNGLTSDVATGITNAITKDGQNVPTTNLPMGGFKHTGVADANGTGQYIAYNQATAVGSLTITTLTAGNVAVTANTVPANGMYLPAANTIGWSTNTTARGSVNSTGNWTFNAPSVGVAATFNGLAGAGIATFQAAAASDAVVVWNLSGSAKQYQLYLKNSDGSFALKDNNVGTDRVSISTNGNVVISPPSSGVGLDVSAPTAGTIALQTNQAASGAEVRWSLANTSNTAGSVARFVISVGGGTADDPYIVTQVSAGQAWSFGLDNSDNDSFKISASTGVGTTDRLAVETDGRLYGTGLHNSAGAVTGTTKQYIASGTYTPTLNNTTNVASSSVSGTFSYTRVGNVVSVAGRIQVDASGTGAVVVEVTLPIASNLTAVADCCGSGNSETPASHTGGGITADTITDEAKYSFTATTDPGSIFHDLIFQYVVL